jgi:hypothetical protein
MRIQALNFLNYIYNDKKITKKVQNLKYALVLLIAPQMRIAWFEA